MYNNVLVQNKFILIYMVYYVYLHSTVHALLCAIDRGMMTMVFNYLPKTRKKYG